MMGPLGHQKAKRGTKGHIEVPLFILVPNGHAGAMTISLDGLPMALNRLFLLPLVALALITSVSAPRADDAPWRLSDALGAPDWLSISGEHRMRLEFLDGQFRPNRSRQDQALMLRTTLHAVAGDGPLRLGLELGDSRVYLDADDTPLGVADVNTADIVQAYLALGTDDLLGSGASARLTLGRQVIHIGSGRQVFRPGFRNVIRPLTGVSLRLKTGRGDTLDAFYTVPVSTEPDDRGALGSLSHSFDKELWQQRFFGLHYRRADLFGVLFPDVWGEVYLYGFRQDDSEAAPTPNRRVTDIGGRLYRAPRAGEPDMDIEASWRFGSRTATSADDDTQPLDVKASLLFASVGYSWFGDSRPRLALEYFLTTGDDDPDDATSGRYERLFSARRRDMGNSGIFGPLNASNHQHIRLVGSIAPTPRTDYQLLYAATFLASRRDVWITTGLRDTSGASGAFIGHLMEGRVRHWLIRDSLRLEVGASLLVFGKFPKSVPGGPAGSRSLYGFGQLTFQF